MALIWGFINVYGEKLVMMFSKSGSIGLRKRLSDWCAMYKYSAFANNAKPSEYERASADIALQRLIQDYCKSIGKLVEEGDACCD
ncbi:hypothetical protein LINPERHAP1_LOCUS8293 [Linum perenne]